MSTGPSRLREFASTLAGAPREERPRTGDAGVRTTRRDRPAAPTAPQVDEGA